MRSQAIGPLAAVRLVSTDPTALGAFYAAAFGFAPGALPAGDAEAEGQLLGLRGARAACRTMTLGGQALDLLAVTPRGRPYPTDTGSADTIFQHVALVVADMDAAMARLAATSGWSAISTAGPERLPASSGGVTAFKFRDPEGHPLEFLAFPPGGGPEHWQRAAKTGPGPCLGYDHSAIAVSDTAASLAFYARLGLARDSGSLNRGEEQARMDAVPGAVVEVTGIGVPGAPPHLELLCYRGSIVRTPTRADDVAATQIVFAVEDAETLARLIDGLGDALVSPGIVTGGGARAALLCDPDGHRLLLRIRAG